MSAIALLRAPIVDADADAWRQDVRAFLIEEMRCEAVRDSLDPSELTGVSAAFERAHHRRAGARGLLGISMPLAAGGGGRPPSWKAAYDFEAARHDAPSIDTAVTLCGTTLARYGPDALRHTELAAMVNGSMTACIAYTEAQAGSDLGAVAATAHRHGDGWVLDGHKVLVTGAHRADVCLTLMRTAADAPPKEAFTLFLVPMHSSGIEITRQPTINGWTLEDIRFDRVAVGSDRVVGEVGNGWAQVLGAIGVERAGAAWLGWSAQRLEALVAIGVNDPRITDLIAGHTRARRFCERVLRRLDAGAPLGHTSSVAKLATTELLQAVAELGAELTATGVPVAEEPTLFTGDRFAFEQLERLHCTIGGGTSEVQRESIARLLGAAVANAAADTAAGIDPASAAGALAAPCRAMFDIAREWVHKREQFGQPLAASQVVRHRLADMLIDVEAIELAAAEPHRTDSEHAASTLVAHRAAWEVVAAAHQLTGGHGYLEAGGLGPLARTVRTQIARNGTAAELRHRIWK